MRAWREIVKTELEGKRWKRIKVSMSVFYFQSFVGVI